MPIYEFECEDCGKVNELLMRSMNDTKAECQFCGSKKLKKRLSTPAVQVKGNSQPPLSCGRTTPCCGRPVPCDTPPCGKR